MAWWRRNPSMWPRTPINRYTRRILRADTSLHRCRGFSKSPSNPAQHKSDDDAKRPQGLSDLEWMQLQHYRRWKRRLQEDPYHVLFGASNDMLSGKGLRDWQWVYKAFPKWMTREMNFAGLGKADGEGKASENNGSKATYTPPPPPQPSTNEVYPKTTNINGNELPKSREPPFKEPSFRAARFERIEYSSGVVSPSDPRRPRECIAPEETQKPVMDASSASNGTLGGQEVSWTPKVSDAQEVTPRKESYNAQGPVLKEPATNKNRQTPPKEAFSILETTFIKEFLADTPGSMESDEKSSDWRVTALDRRIAKGVIPIARRKSNLTDSSTQSTIVIEPPTTPTSAGERLVSSPILSSQASDGDGHISSPKSEALDISRTPANSSEAPSVVQNASIRYEKDDHIQPDNWFPHGIRKVKSKSPIAKRSSTQPSKKPDGSPGIDVTVSEPSKSPSDISRQILENDLDLLSAESIRASMGAKRSKISSRGEKQEIRTSLEDDFKSVHENEPELDPAFGASVKNDQLMRRAARQLNEGKNASATLAEKESKDIHIVRKSEQIIQAPSFSQPKIETSLDRITRQLQAGNDAFANLSCSAHIQDKPNIFLKDQYGAIISRVKACRYSIRHIAKSLRRNFPAIEPLLARLQDNESNVIRSVKQSILQSKSNSIVAVDFKHSIEAIRDEIKMTEKDFEEACRALEMMKNGNSKVVSEGMKDQLKAASTVLNKNAKLTRRSIFNIQSLWDNQSNSSYGVFFRDIENRLLALKETQLALVRIVQRLMQMFGVHPEAPETSAIPKPSTKLDDNMASPGPILNKIAKDKLKEEICAQKSAMQGLSDDGYTRQPKQFKKRSFDHPKSLAHSLFRPFRPTFESLGKIVESTAERVEAQAAKDKALIHEIKKSYEDVYGPITVDHTQVKVNDSNMEEPTTGETSKLSDEENIGSTHTGVQATGSSPTKAPQGKVKADRNPEIPAVSTPSSASPSIIEGAEASDRKNISTLETDGRAHYLATNPMRDPVLEQTSQISTTTSSSSPPTLVDDQLVGSTEAETSASSPVLTSSEPREHVINEAPVEEATLKAHIYRILAYDPSTEEIHITTTIDQSSQSSVLAPAIPLHEALAAVSSPAKFISHLSSSMQSEIVTAKPNLIVLREPQLSRNYIPIPPSSHDTEVQEEEWRPRNAINPIDGTTRLSPTGFVGVEPDLREEELRGQQRQEWYDKWRRENAELSMGDRANRDYRRWGKDDERSGRKRRGGVASLFRTTIVAGAGCYVIGVIGELMK